MSNKPWYDRWTEKSASHFASYNIFNPKNIGVLVVIAIFLIIFGIIISVVHIISVVSWFNLLFIPITLLILLVLYMYLLGMTYSNYDRLIKLKERDNLNEEDKKNITTFTLKIKYATWYVTATPLLSIGNSIIAFPIMKSFTDDFISNYEKKK